ncbi:hypothetical protein EVB91_252 [Rhizobium phage RHph_I1_18]|nr:hypothetical protein EVB91_252 [Rhizobium phage RHph_I1_18]
MSTKFPYEICDLVAVTVDKVDYYGYVDDIKFDLKVIPPTITITVEFFPGCRKQFDFSEIRPIELPREKST